ncbi:uncharacterized protein LOC62_07G009727 [Vanrija pseudolonga]|uniref:F-box domain-containing protein n=1 Tax=Vanrija pseudolonga TaxID=143232 RepID=A0AAF0YH02_9TREE|nr:hypothetical protein LOC62_07G009727 [Vanrija pseudolonga]
MPDPCTAFDDYVLGQIFARLPIDVLRLRAYNVSRGWRAALDASKAVRAALLVQPNLNRHVQDHLRDLERKASFVDGAEAVDWNDRALAFLAQESAWRGGRAKLKYGRSVLESNAPTLASYDCITRKLLILDTPEPEMSGDPSLEWAIHVVDMDSLAVERKIALPPGLDYPLFCEDHLGHVLGQLVTTPGEPGQPDRCTVNIWVQVRDEGEFEWVARTGYEVTSDDTIEGFKLLASHPTGSIVSNPGADYRVDERPGGRMTLTAVTQTSRGRVRIHHIADRLPIGSAPLPGEVSRVKLQDVGDGWGQDDHFSAASSIDDNWIFSLESQLRIYSRNGKHLLTLPDESSGVPGFTTSGHARRELAPAVGYPIHPITDYLVDEDGIPGLRMPEALRRFRPQPGVHPRGLSVHRLSVPAQREGPEYDDCLLGVRTNKFHESDPYNTWGIWQFQFVNKALILTFVSGGLLVIPRYEAVFSAVAALEAAERLRYVASKTIMIDTGFELFHDGVLGQAQFDSYGTRFLMAVNDLVVIIDTADISTDTPDAPLPVLALTGHYNTVEDDLPAERFFLTSWGLFHAINMLSLGDGDVQVARETAKGDHQREYPFDEQLDGLWDSDRYASMMR